MHQWQRGRLFGFPIHERLRLLPHGLRSATVVVVHFTFGRHMLRPFGNLRWLEKWKGREVRQAAEARWSESWGKSEVRMMHAEARRKQAGNRQRLVMADRRLVMADCRRGRRHERRQAARMRQAQLSRAGHQRRHDTRRRNQTRRRKAAGNRMSGSSESGWRQSGRSEARRCLQARWHQRLRCLQARRHQSRRWSQAGRSQRRPGCRMSHRWCCADSRQRRAQAGRRRKATEMTGTRRQRLLLLHRCRGSGRGTSGRLACGCRHSGELVGRRHR